ncbi:transglutaminase domain-containing protein [Paenibacillus sp. YN15]|uniref:DUF4129 domain-containing transglutaminase family protein n=1 Tax=Paenibacillus sp. YN15 TaxID=1742774 RepID=UPI000DCF62E9|nr:transglutaminase domain-containing protein [Paenibacillus sp. YN15]RAV01685.1 cysteine protease [Paenibacillus sp. YN15]
MDEANAQTGIPGNSGGFSLRALLTEDWHRKLTCLFAVLLLLQYVSWFAAEENMWWPETVAMVQASLWISFAVDILPRVNIWLRKCIQLWLLIIINGIYSGYEPVLYKLHSMQDFGNWVYDNFWQLNPFVWFSLGAWAIYSAMSWWLKSRWRIGAAVILSVLIFAVRDSFSTLYLWQETALVIFCGLMLLVVSHFAEVKRKNPYGWAYLMEYPATLIATILLLLGITMIPGTVMPTIRPILTDPYTAYMQWKGEEVPAYGKTIAGLASSSSASSVSGYSRDDSSLGGSFSFDYSPVFSVDTTHRAYMRGETRSFYNGNGWEMSDGDKQAANGPVVPGNLLARDQRFNVSKLKTVTVKQIVKRLKEDDTYPVLFGAFGINKVEAINDEASGADRLRWAPRQMELRWSGTRRDSYPETYTIESEMPTFTGDELRSAGALPNPAQFSEYLQLPRDLPQRVRQLAQQITAAGATPYDKAKLLEQYLQSSFPYTNEPQTESAKSADFVDRFLFEIKEGYCDYFSSAMAVMSRTIGIPSRWVKGYTAGQQDIQDPSFGDFPVDATDDPTGMGIYTVRNSDAHSWVELYFPGYGWIPFEATSGFTLPAVAPAAETALPDIATDPLDSSAVDGATATPGEGKGHPYLAAAIIAAAVLAAGAAGWWYRKRLFAWAKKNRLLGVKRSYNPEQRIVSEYARMLKLYRRRGVPIHDYETARETIERLKRKDVWLSKDLDDLLTLFEKAKYSPRRVTPEESGRAIRIVDKLKKAT